MTKTIDTLRDALPGLLLSATIALAVRFEPIKNHSLLKCYLCLRYNL